MECDPATGASSRCGGSLRHDDDDPPVLAVLGARWFSFDLLLALGATREWLCVSEGWECDKRGAVGHSNCRFVWVVEEDR
jgi:hypothetical protein